MIIDVYTIAFNEATIMPKFLQHYRQYARRIVVYDNGSTDDTVKICKQYKGVEVRAFGNGELNDAEYLEIKNNVWRESDADYVFIVDADEFIYSPLLLNTLRANLALGVKVIKTMGFNMICPWPITDKPLIRTHRYGVPASQYDKCAIFSPTIAGINYQYGCHTCTPTEKVYNSSIKLLHYKYIIGVDYVKSKHDAYVRRMSNFNKKHMLGGHYFDFASIETNFKTKTLQII